MRLPALACPYCFALSEEACHEDCPQYPVTWDGERVYADPDVLLRMDPKELRRIRRDRKMPDTVGLPSARVQPGSALQSDG